MQEVWFYYTHMDTMELWRCGYFIYPYYTCSNEYFHMHWQNKRNIFQIVLSIWRPRTSTTIQRPQFHLHGIEDESLRTRMTEDTTSINTEDRARIAEYSNSSVTTRDQHIKKNKYELEEEFKSRNLALLRGCDEFEARTVTPLLIWRLAFKKVLPGPVTIFTVPKVGHLLLLRIYLEELDMFTFKRLYL